MSIFKKKKGNSEYSAVCSICENAKILENGEVFCRIKKQSMSEFDTCRRYSYDILKRKPRKPELPEMPELSDI